MVCESSREICGIAACSCLHTCPSPPHAHTCGNPSFPAKRSARAAGCVCLASPPASHPWICLAPQWTRSCVSCGPRERAWRGRGASRCSTRGSGAPSATTASTTRMRRSCVGASGTSESRTHAHAHARTHATETHTHCRHEEHSHTCTHTHTHGSRYQKHTHTHTHTHTVSEKPHRQAQFHSAMTHFQLSPGSLQFYPHNIQVVSLQNSTDAQQSSQQPPTYIAQQEIPK